MFQKTYIVLGNFVAAVNMMRRRDPVLDKWFEDCFATISRNDNFM